MKCSAVRLNILCAALFESGDDVCCCYFLLCMSIKHCCVRRRHNVPLHSHSLLHIVNAIISSLTSYDFICLHFSLLLTLFQAKDDKKKIRAHFRQLFACAQLDGWNFCRLALVVFAHTYTPSKTNNDADADADARAKE